LPWLWGLAVACTFGFAGPFLFGYAAAKTRRRAWAAFAVLYAVLAFGGFTLIEIGADDSAPREIGSAMLLLAWIVGPVHVFLMRREYERRLDSPRVKAIERARAQVAERTEARRLVEAEPDVALELGVGRPDLHGARAMGVVDINRAGAGALAELPGVDRALAGEIVRVREEIDGFGTLEEMGMVLHLDGDLVEDLRPYVVFIPR
jgi:DNA uptake protein ComE-like DNA-binding protein